MFPVEVHIIFSLFRLLVFQVPIPRRRDGPVMPRAAVDAAHHLSTRSKGRRQTQYYVHPPHPASTRCDIGDFDPSPRVSRPVGRTRSPPGGRRTTTTWATTRYGTSSPTMRLRAHFLRFPVGAATRAWRNGAQAGPVRTTGHLRTLRTYFDITKDRYYTTETTCYIVRMIKLAISRRRNKKS